MENDKNKNVAMDTKETKALIDEMIKKQSKILQNARQGLTYLQLAKDKIKLAETEDEIEDIYILLYVIKHSYFKDIFSEEELIFYQNNMQFNTTKMCFFLFEKVKAIIDSKGDAK